MLYAEITARRSSGRHVVKCLLCVDDEARILHGLNASLQTRRMDWAMHLATGVSLAIELMPESRFNILVTDLRMPGVDALRAERSVDAVHAETPRWSFRL
jgi:YesN/AraC family two-component response regulator